jgi:hypothetical protein
MLTDWEKAAPTAIVDKGIKGTNHSLRYPLQSLAEFTEYSTKYYSFASFLVGQSSDKFTDIFKSVSNQSNVERPPACYTGAITRTSRWEGTWDYLFTVILPVEQKFQLSFSLLLFLRMINWWCQGWERADVTSFRKFLTELQIVLQNLILLFFFPWMDQCCATRIVKLFRPKYQKILNMITNKKLQTHEFRLCVLINYVQEGGTNIWTINLFYFF